ncbi:MAG: PAS domain-containing protein [Deltaproteobacteria bacterium]|nr:PAS domain-containing protein [Deltaproteobacteria bacterium]
MICSTPELEHYLKRELYERVRSDSTIFEFLQAGSLDGIWYWDAERPENTWMSPRLKEVLGYTDEEAPNSASWWQGQMFQEDFAVCAENFRKHAEDPGHPFDQVVRYRHKDGSTVWVRCRGIGLRDERGRLVRLLGAHTNVTALKKAQEEAAGASRVLREANARMRAEESLRRSEEQFGAVVESMSEGLVLGSLDGTLLHWNTAALRMHDIASMDEVLRPLSDFTEQFEFTTLDGRPLPLEEWPMRKLMRGEPVRDMELEISRIGTPWRRVFSYGGARVKGTSGRTLVILNISDITEKKRAEEALRHSEARFRQLAEAINEVFWLTDLAKERIIYVSPAYEGIWGRTCQSLYDAPGDWLSFIHPDDREAVRAALPKQTLGNYDEEYRVVQPSGAVRWIRDRAFPVRDAEGKVFRVAGIAQDVTERRRLGEQLRQAQKMEAVGSLAGGVAHDFNNILSVILGYSSLVEQSIDPTNPIAGQIQEIRNAAERAAGLTRQLLAFSRQQILQPQVVDLNRIVSGLDKMLQRLIGEDIELRTVLTSQRAMVNVDPGQLEQVIMNLAVNARDAMPTGGSLTIEIDLEEVDEAYAQQHPGVKPGSHVRLSVADTGTGMDQATQARVFEPFFTTKQLGKGTGLGLSTVFGIVQQSGGNIGLYSEVAHGTTFRILLPRVAEMSTTPPRPVAPVRNDKLRGHETVLLVEDDERLRRVTRTILTRSGYQVLEAQSGGDALLICEQHPTPIDVLLTDVIMPRMSGPVLAARILAMRPKVRIVYMSGYTEDSVVRHGICASEIPFVQKPFTQERLLTKVREALDA